MDAESYSLHTFEALLTQSMENLGKITVEKDFYPEKLGKNTKKLILANMF